MYNVHKSKQSTNQLTNRIIKMNYININNAISSFDIDQCKAFQKKLKLEYATGGMDVETYDDLNSMLEFQKLIGFKYI